MRDYKDGERQVLRKRRQVMRDAEEVVKVFV